MPAPDQDQRRLAGTFTLGTELRKLRKEGLGGISSSLKYETNRESMEGHSFLGTSSPIDVNNCLALRMSADLHF